MKKALSLIIAVVMISLCFAPALTASAASQRKVTFGSYPQTEVTKKSELSKLEAAQKNWKSYNYSYCDMEYADMDTDGDGDFDYRAVKITTPRSASLISRPWKNDKGQWVGTRQPYAGYNAGNTYYFKYEPIVWRVLDADKGLLLSDIVLDSQPYTAAYAEVKDWVRIDGGIYRKFVYGNAPASVWEYSAIRTWLNETFYNTAFTQDEKANIKTSEIDNVLLSFATFDNGTLDNNNFTVYSKYPNTRDKVFLPSASDISNTKYGFTARMGPNSEPADRLCISTDYAKSQGLDYMLQIRELERENSSYLLRTTGYGDKIWTVHADGTANEFTEGIDNTDDGIRPEICVNNVSSLKTYRQSFFAKLLYKIKIFFKVFFTN